ncbi:hypothetical protein EON65_45965 [archaeon]|nr:MAG: hypothetical protein EON65_45965 [archaeon]
MKQIKEEAQLLRELSCWQNLNQGPLVFNKTLYGVAALSMPLAVLAQAISGVVKFNYNFTKQCLQDKVVAGNLPKYLSVYIVCRVEEEICRTDEPSGSIV